LTSSADHHPEARLEVLADAAPLRSVGLDGTPFQIGRGSPGPLRLALDDARVSRSSAEVVYSGGRFSVRDLGQRNGLFLNGRRVEESAALTDGDTLTFGAAPSVRVVFRSPSGERSLTSLLSRLDESVRDQAVDPYLQQLNLLLEATALLEKQLPTGEVLSAMVDQAIRITRAERGALLEASSAGGLEIRIRRRLGGGDGRLGNQGIFSSRNHGWLW
jgi:hypothetical protein